MAVKQVRNLQSGPPMSIRGSSSGLTPLAYFFGRRPIEATRPQPLMFSLMSFWYLKHDSKIPSKT